MVDRVAQFGRRGRSAPGEADPLEDWVELPSYRPSFGALLVRAGLASDQDVKLALEEGVRTGERLGEVVIRRGWATEDRIAQLLAEQWQLPFREAERVAVDPNALQRVPLAVARELRALPIGFENGGVVLAIADPNEDLFAAVKSRVGEASYVVVARSVLDPLIENPSSRYALEEGGGHAHVGDSTTFDVHRAIGESVTDVLPPATPLTLVDELRPAEPVPLRPAAADQFTLIEPASIAADHYEPVDYLVPEEPPYEQPIADAPEAVARATFEIGDVAPVIESIDAATTGLARVRTEVGALGTSLAAAQTANADYEAALAMAAETHERDQATIRRLEGELSQREDVFQALKSQIAGLTRTLDTGEGGGHPSNPYSG